MHSWSCLAVELLSSFVQTFTLEWRTRLLDFFLLKFPRESESLWDRDARRLNESPQAECDIPDSVPSRGLTVTRCGPACKHRQFRFRCGKARKTAIQADRNLREYQNAGMVDIPETGEMNHHLGSKFRLIARLTQCATHAPPQTSFGFALL